MQTDTHTVALQVAVCSLEDSEDIHFQLFICLASSSLTFVKSLVCLSHSLGCRTAPPVILLTHAHTISFCLSVFSPQEFHCAEQSFVKTLSSFYQLCPPYTSSNLYISSSGLCSLTLSHQTHKYKYTQRQRKTTHTDKTSSISKTSQAL